MTGSVTVVIPTRDRAALLRQTLRSVREQTVPPARVIVADDGSTDDTERVVSEAGAERIHRPGGGWRVAGARNAALPEVTTELVGFLDSDDLMLPGALETLARALAADPEAPFAYGQGLAARREPGGWVPEGLIGPDPEELEEPLGAMFARNSVPSCGALVRTAAIRSVGGYDEEVEWSEDHHLWIRLARLGAPAYVDEVVGVHRRHPGNRHTPRLAARDSPKLLELARAEPALEAWLPRRSGVELCEVAIAVAREEPLRVPGTVWRLMRGRRGKRAILAHSARQFAARRRWAREGRRLFDADADLRRWLSPYS
jgi:glycosyltransferase involved in cell wall biosynthesis